MRLRAVRAVSYTTNFFSKFAVCTMFTASIAHVLFSKPRGRIRRTRRTDRLCFEALCLVCGPPRVLRVPSVSTQGTGVSTQGIPCRVPSLSTQGNLCEYSGYPLLGMHPVSTQSTECENLG